MTQYFKNCKCTSICKLHNINAFGTYSELKSKQMCNLEISLGYYIANNPLKYIWRVDYYSTYTKIKAKLFLLEISHVHNCCGCGIFGQRARHICIIYTLIFNDVAHYQNVAKTNFFMVERIRSTATKLCSAQKTLT